MNGRTGNGTRNGTRSPAYPMAIDTRSPISPLQASNRAAIQVSGEGRGPRIRPKPERKRRTVTAWPEGGVRALLVCALGAALAAAPLYSQVAAGASHPRPLALAAERGPGVGPAGAVQSLPADTFVDARARSLFEAARSHWLSVGSSILSYDATISSRFALKLRTPLKDRTLFRAEETSRVHWNADSTLVVQTFAAQSVTAEGGGPPGRLNMTGAVFDPTSDQFIFGFSISRAGTDGGDEETRPTTRESDNNAGDQRSGIQVRFQHPIAPGAEAHYRYQASDSLTLSLPDGGTVRAVSLEFIPRESVGRLLSGILWIEPESGSLVRAVYRLSEAYDVEEVRIPIRAARWLIRGLLNPLEFNVSLVTVEYSLWDLEHWMPARWRIEGVARAGVLRAAGILERSYQILDVVGTRDAETPPDPEAVLDRWLADDTFGRFRAVDPADRGDPYGLDDRDPGDGRAAQDSVSREGGQTVHLLVPEDPGDLISSDLLPPPVWVEAPGFSTADELAVLERDLADLSLPDGNLNRFDFDTGPQLDELTRYNRAEGLAIGARAGWSRATGIGLIGLEGRGWIGIGSGQPDLRLELGWESPRHRLSLTGHHRVDDVDPRAGNLGIVNSLTAFFFGRDDGDYFRASGARLTWQPTGVRRPWWNVTLAAEEHRALPNEVDFSDPFRPALLADRARSTRLPFHALVGHGSQRRPGWVGGPAQGAEGDFSWFRACNPPGLDAGAGTARGVRGRRRPDLGGSAAPEELVSRWARDAPRLPRRFRRRTRLPARACRARARRGDDPLGPVLRLGLGRRRLLERLRRRTHVGRGRLFRSRRPHPTRHRPGPSVPKRLAPGVLLRLDSLAWLARCGLTRRAADPRHFPRPLMRAP